MNYVEADGHLGVPSWDDVKSVGGKGLNAAKKVGRAHWEVSKLGSAMNPGVDLVHPAVQFKFRVQMMKGLYHSGRDTVEGLSHPDQISLDPRVVAKGFARGVAREAKSGYSEGGVSGAAARTYGYVGGAYWTGRGAGAGLRIANRAATTSSVGVRTVLATDRLMTTRSAVGQAGLAALGKGGSIAAQAIGAISGYFPEIGAAINRATQRVQTALNKRRGR